MKQMSRRTRKIVTILAVLALLILILPVAVMAREGRFIPTLPANAAEQARLALAASHPTVEVEPEITEEDEEEDEEEPELENQEVTEPSETETEESENKSERALFVEERNQQAEDWGIPAGHVNLFDKLGELTGETRESIYERFTNESEPMTVQDLMKEIKDARKTQETTGTESGEAGLETDESTPGQGKGHKKGN